MIVYLIIAALVLAMCAFGVYSLARFMKGKLIIELSRSSAITEELISGRVTLIAKKKINGLLKVSLVGTEERTRGTGDDKRYEDVEVYRYDHVLEEKRVFDAGTEETYDFDLLAPKLTEVSTQVTIIKEMIESPSDGLMGKLKAKAAAKMAEHEASGKRLDQVDWKVESHLDADGVDLVKRMPCKVILKA